MKLPNPGLRSALIKKAITITPHTSILDAIEVIQKYRIGRLVVIDRSFSPIGIITEKDIMRSLWPLNNKPLDSLRVQDLMSKNLITAKKSDYIYNCAKLMKQNNISSLVILRDDNSMEGIVTKTDLVFNFLIQQSEQYKISQIMTDKVVTVSTGDSL
ncbi:MAG: cyclic nucleotide-binding/CBS domain-containing protein, partial [Candidatus Nitrosotenuis sp.]